MNTLTTRSTMSDIEKILDYEENSHIDTAIEKLNDVFTLKGLWNNKRKKNQKKTNKKWYHQSCAEMSRRLKTLGKLCEKDPKNPFLRGHMITARKEYKKLIKLTKRQWKNTMIRRLEEIEEENPAEYWKLIKKLREKKVENNIANPEEFESFFIKLFSDTPPDGNAGSEVNTKHKEIAEKVVELMKKPEEIMQDYTLEELKTAIDKLKNNRASMLVPAEMLKASPEFVLRILLKLTNKIKNSCYFPQEWAKGITTLLHKEGDEDDPNNYRAITVADALSKIMTIMMSERIVDKLEKEQIINHLQIGFQKKARPADHLFVLKNIFDKYLCQGKKVYTCFVDFQKAYDNVWRTGLYYKLLKHGIDLQMVKLIKDMYEKTSQVIRMNTKVTKPLKTYKGVRQGCVLSPHLFNIFINDLPGIFDDSCRPVENGNKNLSCLMFADDIVLLAESKEGLQTCLNKLEGYAKDWKMTVNKKKTKVMIIQNRGKMPAIDITYEGQRLEVVDNYKYLGTIVSRTGSFKLNEVYLKNKGLKARYAITRNVGIDCKVSTMMRLFQRMIEPILLYNCEVAQACIPNTWDIDKFKEKMWEDREVDKVTKGFIRQLLGVNKKTKIMGLRAETGKYPLVINIYTQMIRYWTRLLSTNSTLLQDAHMDNIERLKKGQSNWIQPVLFILRTCGITQIDISNICKEEKAFARRIRERLQDLYKERWNEEARKENKGKLTFYHELKKYFQFEEYLDNIPRGERRAITKLRLSCHALPVETMRYQKTTSRKLRAERKCTLCNKDEAGDEWHYLVSCQNNDIHDIRTDFIETVVSLQPQLKTFGTRLLMHYCVSLHDHHLQSETALFVKRLLKSYSDNTKTEEGTCSLM